MDIEDDYKILKSVSETKDIQQLRLIETPIEILFYNAIETSDVSVVQFLLNIKLVNLKSVTLDGRRPIHIAAQYGDLTIIKLIVNAGSPLNVIDNMGSTPLHLTLEAGYDEAAMYFVKEGATINRPFKYHTGESPIHMAAQLGMDRVLDCMLKRGGNPNLPEKTGLTPLHMAVQYRHCSTSLILCQAGAYVDVPDRNGKSPFFMALMQMSCDMVRTLLPFVHKLNSVDVDGRTPLHYVASARTSSNINDIVDLLLDFGVDVTKCDKDGRTALHEAAASGNVVVAEKLLDRGAQLNIVDQIIGETPLLVASAYNRIDVMKMLLSYGADPNICDKNLKSPLHKVQVCQNSTSLGSKVACSQLLLEAGAKVNACDNRGCSVLDECIFAYGMTKDQSYLMAILPTLVQAGLRLRPPSRGMSRILQNSPLCCLAWNGELEATKFLIDSGWDLNGETSWIRLPGKTREIEAFFQILREISHQPCSLQRICRTAIREYLTNLTQDTDITSSVMYLNLPWILKPYILCNVTLGSLFD